MATYDNFSHTHTPMLEAELISETLIFLKITLKVSCPTFALTGTVTLTAAAASGIRRRLQRLRLNGATVTAY
jgi:hypothetical protein